MKIYKINYVKKWGNDGTVYHQTIKIDTQLKEFYNIYLLGLKQKAKQNYTKNRCFTAEEVEHLNIEYLKIGVNYITLTELALFRKFIKYLNDSPLIHNKIDTKRLKQNKNTIIEVIQ